MGKSPQTPKLYYHDYWMKALILPMIPDFVQPNQITVLRMLLTPVVLWLLFIENYTVALPLFVLTAFTDMIDGSLARVRNKITPWGMFFDPVADKFLIGSVAILIAVRFYHPGIVFAAIALDILPAIRLISKKNEGKPLAANMWGKWKMFLQCVSIAILLAGITLQLPILVEAGETTLLVAIGFAVIALITYSL